MKTKLTPAEKEARKLQRQTEREAAKTTARIESEKNQKPVASITLSIEWKRSAMWGNNPRLTAQVEFKDGTSTQSVYSCSGCGYDKESTVIADAFNGYLKYKLHTITNGEAAKHPYGMYTNTEHKHYSGGIGTDCYYAISEFIGGGFERIATGKKFDVYKYTDAPTTPPAKAPKTGLELASMVAMMGSVLISDKKEANDFKLRMIQAGAGGALSMPADWDTLGEDEKQRRLDAIIEMNTKTP